MPRKRGLGSTVCRFKEGVGLSRKSGEGGGGCFLKGFNTPMHAMLLGQTEGERKAFLRGSKKWGHIVRLPPRALGFHKRNILSFCEI